MSPESITKRQYSRASDVWMFGGIYNYIKSFSIGALVVEMINQAPPWHTIMNHMDVVQIVCYETGIPVITSSIHPKLLDIVKVRGSLLLLNVRDA